MHTALISLCEDGKPFNVGGINYNLVDVAQLNGNYIRVILEKVCDY